MTTLAGPKKSYCTLADEVNIASYEAEKLTKRYPLRPSSAGYCARKLAYDLAAHDGLIEPAHEDRKPNSVRLLSFGHAIERESLYLLKKIPGFQVRFSQQVVDLFKLPSGRNIEGSLDAVMWSADHRGLLDVKSVGDRYSDWRSTKWDEMMYKYDQMPELEKFDENAWWAPDTMKFFKALDEGDALHHNIPQINLYLMSDFMQSRGVDHGVVYRYNKNNSKHMEIRFAPSPELFQWVRDRYSNIETSVARGDISGVPRESKLGSMACAYCPYAARCRPDQATKKAFYKTLADKDWAVKLTEEGYQELNEKLVSWEAALSADTQKEKLEQEILQLLENADLGKVKTDTGMVYEAKHLKSPKPHYELRRSKE